MNQPDPSVAAYLPLTPPVFHVLIALADGEKHGYAILREVEDRTGGRVRLSSGTLYAIIKRLLATEKSDKLLPARFAHHRQSYIEPEPSAS